jgi:hypothetical protein
MRPKASKSCPGVGLLSELYPGWADVADWPRIGKISIGRRSLSCTSPPFASCSEGSVINHEVFGPTLRRRFAFVTLVPEFASPAFRTALEAAGVPATVIDQIVDRMRELNEAIATRGWLSIEPVFPLVDQQGCVASAARVTKVTARAFYPYRDCVRLHMQRLLSCVASPLSPFGRRAEAVHFCFGFFWGAWSQ